MLAALDVQPNTSPKYNSAEEEHRATFCSLDSHCRGYCPPVHAGLPQAHCCSALGKVAEASLNGHQLGACPLAVRAHQSGGSADQGLKEKVRSSGLEDGEGITVLFQR